MIGGGKVGSIRIKLLTRPFVENACHRLDGQTMTNALNTPPPDDRTLTARPAGCHQGAGAGRGHLSPGGGCGQGTSGGQCRCIQLSWKCLYCNGRTYTPFSRVCAMHISHDNSQQGSSNSIEIELPISLQENDSWSTCINLRMYKPQVAFDR